MKRRIRKLLDKIIRYMRNARRLNRKPLKNSRKIAKKIYKFMRTIIKGSCQAVIALLAQIYQSAHCADALVWLFGENLGATANNNSFYFWKHVAGRNDGIQKYLILSRTKRNRALVRSLPQEKQSWVIWRNSLKHHCLYRAADMFFVTLSFKDIRPDHLGGQIKKPLVYLQHGTSGIKRFGYTGKSYNNNLFRFVIYNEKIIPNLLEEHNFQPYQIYRGIFHPRYQELVRRNRTKPPKSSGGSKQILWFLTWRDYFKNHAPNPEFMQMVEGVLTDPRLVQHLEATGSTLRVCTHPFMEKALLHSLGNVRLCPNIQLAVANQIDVMDELVNADLMVTDYSSVGFDFTFLGKPVLLFQPDLEQYSEMRSFFCTWQELDEVNLTTQNQLIDALLEENHALNPFFAARTPAQIDYDAIVNGEHIDRMYQDFAWMAQNKITFLGYNFFGVGGTVSATKALAEALLHQGYMVQLLSLKRNQAYRAPNALTVHALYTERSKSPKEWLKYLLIPKVFFGDLILDLNAEYLIPYVGIALRRFLKHTKSCTVISTRETLHLPLYKAHSPFLKNKLFYFHSRAEAIPQTFPDVLDALKQVRLSKALFVTEAARQSIRDSFGYEHYDQYAITGNTVESRVLLPLDDVRALEEKPVYYGIMLTRLSKDRLEDIRQIFSYGEYLKANGIKNIVLKIFGSGEAIRYFKEELKRRNLNEQILCCGRTLQPIVEIREADFVLNLGAQSFGMVYLEAALNGKLLFTTPTDGANEVLHNWSFPLINSPAELVEKFYQALAFDRDFFVEQYKIIAERYAPEAAASKVIAMLE
ncbi:MAG: CDP-glycerol glycerophosphotransferase family protein [Oscillospiraceae bacterium]|jgi:glycosyltransferase involved in cell wall biosynthesis|nr:CDP-glycerol glycerophosphotransferase family protein [Oscillospiraceae bacterium]